MQTLTEQQRRKFQTDGYLLIEAALDVDDVRFFSREIDRIRQLPGYEPDNDPDLPIGHYAWLDHAKSLDNNGFMDRRELLPYGNAFIDLIDRPPVFDYIVDLMGTNIMLSMTQAIVRPSTEKFPGYTHTDGGESLRLTRVAPDAPPIAMKVIYVLTDTLDGDCGNFTVFPGSHTRQVPFGTDESLTPYSEGAVQLRARAGDAIIFPHSLWHGPARNLSGAGRKTLLYNYCQLWVRSYDSTVSEDVLDQCTPRQRRLCGDLGYDFRPGSYFYVPKDQDSVLLGT
jgi:ectoine hydroxylase-related dioxygenase (phytanoyl-CoA dioxygenase family)